MSTIFCPNCGAPNRETAKYCGKCAGLLAPLSPATMVMDYEPERKRRRRRRSGSRRAARPAKRSPWPFVLIVCLALGAGLASASRRPGSSHTPSAARACSRRTNACSRTRAQPGA